MAVNDREFGELLGKVSAIEADLKRVERNVDSMGGKIDGILSLVDKTNGGLRVAIWFSGLLGAGAAFVAMKVLPLFLTFIPKL